MEKYEEYYVYGDNGEQLPVRPWKQHWCAVCHVVFTCTHRRGERCALDFKTTHKEHKMECPITHCKCNLCEKDFLSIEELTEHNRRKHGAFRAS